MIEYKTGDLLAEEADALVNAVNCVGVMGRGIAAQFKKAWPANFKAYAAACKREEVRPGEMFIHETRSFVEPRFIINFPTKRHWRAKSRMEDIESGLEALVREVRERGIRSIAIPPLGAGLGGLRWEDVRQRIEHAAQQMPEVRVIVFEPKGAPASAGAQGVRKVEMTPGRAALVGLMDRYLGGLLDPFVTLLEVHKLAYFLQAAGEPLRLKLTPALYGPYAENLRHVMHQIEGVFVKGYADGGDSPGKELELLDRAAERAKDVLAELPETQERFDRVSKLVSGFETPFGLELLSTVHWVLEHEEIKGDQDLVARTHARGERNKRFSDQQIVLARKTLEQHGFLPAA